MSPQQISILSHISNGCGGSKNIAHCMGITSKSVEHSLALIRRTLGAFDTAHAVAIAIREGHIK